MRVSYYLLYFPHRCGSPTWSCHWGAVVRACRTHEVPCVEVTLPIENSWKPLVMADSLLLKMVIYSGFSHWKWWFIVDFPIYSWWFSIAKCESLPEGNRFPCFFPVFVQQKSGQLGATSRIYLQNHRRPPWSPWASCWCGRMVPTHRPQEAFGGLGVDKSISAMGWLRIVDSVDISWALEWPIVDFGCCHSLGAWAQKEMVSGWHRYSRVPILYQTCRLHQITVYWISIISMASIIVVLGRYTLSILKYAFLNLVVVISVLYNQYIIMIRNQMASYSQIECTC